jgi:hypothetical protein
VTPGNQERKSSTEAPPSRFSKRATTGTRVPRETERLSGHTLQVTCSFKLEACVSPAPLTGTPDLKMGGTSNRLDETYVKGGAEWKYLYRRELRRADN